MASSFGTFLRVIPFGIFDFLPKTSFFDLWGVPGSPRGPLWPPKRPVLALFSTRFQAGGVPDLSPGTFSARGPVGGAGTHIWGVIGRLLTFEAVRRPPPCNFEPRRVGFLGHLADFGRFWGSKNRRKGAILLRKRRFFQNSVFHTVLTFPTWPHRVSRGAQRTQRVLKAQNRLVRGLDGFSSRFCALPKLAVLAGRNGRNRRKWRKSPKTSKKGLFRENFSTKKLLFFLKKLFLFSTFFRKVSTKKVEKFSKKVEVFSKKKSENFQPKKEAFLAENVEKSPKMAKIAKNDEKWHFSWKNFNKKVDFFL